MGRARGEVIGADVDDLAADVLRASEREGVHPIDLKLVERGLGVDLILRHGAGNHFVEELAKGGS